MDSEIARKILEYQERWNLDTRENIDGLLCIQYPKGLIRNSPKVAIYELGYHSARKEAFRLIGLAERHLEDEEKNLEDALQEALAEDPVISLDRMAIEEQRQQWLSAQGIEPEIAPYIDTSGFSPALFYPKNKKTA
jgi:hypothetical protein